MAESEVISMAMDDIILGARNAIGQAASDDYVIAPTKHAEELEGTAPSLARVLRGAAAETMAREFELLDSRALRAQGIFMRAANSLNFAVLITACLAAALLTLGSLELSAAPLLKATLLIVLGVAAASTGGLGAMLHYHIRQGGLFERWMKDRAGAETHRLRYFETVISAEGSYEAGSPMPLASFQLEYFRRYQLDVQVAYYQTRGDRHRRAADKTLGIGGLAVFIAAITTAVSGLLGALTAPSLASIAAIGVVGAALASFASAREAITQDRRNAERYERTRTFLVQLQTRLGRVRLAAASGDREPLKEFVASVQDQLSLEHRQWLETADTTAAGLIRLDASLSNYPTTLT